MGMGTVERPIMFFSCRGKLAPTLVFCTRHVDVDRHAIGLRGLRISCLQANSLRAEYLELMDRCVESNDEDDLEAALLQVGLCIDLCGDMRINKPEWETRSA